MYAYLANESYRIFRKLQAGDPITPGEFWPPSSTSSTYVEFVPVAELEAPDRKLLKALGHTRAAKSAPMFRTIRPGYHPGLLPKKKHGR